MPGFHASDIRDLKIIFIFIITLHSTYVIYIYFQRFILFSYIYGIDDYYLLLVIFIAIIFLSYYMPFSAH